MKLQLNKEIQSDSGNFYKPMKSFVKMVINVVDLVLPPRCALSGQVVSAQGQILPEEWMQLEFISDPQCKCCGYPFDFKMETEMECALCLKDRPEFDKARAPLIYNDKSRDLVLRFKHADQIHIIDSFMPWVMRSGENLITEADILLPVPLHRFRLIKRRYNQAALMAQYISKKSKKPWAYDVLIRARSTKTQGTMKADERRKNVRKAFEVKPEKLGQIMGKNVLLLDDVYTTGATVRECTRTLLAAGATKVNVLTVTKVVKL